MHYLMKSFLILKFEKLIKCKNRLFISSDLSYPVIYCFANKSIRFQSFMNCIFIGFAGIFHIVDGNFGFGSGHYFITEQGFFPSLIEID